MEDYPEPFSDIDFNNNNIGNNIRGNSNNIRDNSNNIGNNSNTAASRQPPIMAQVPNSNITPPNNTFSSDQEFWQYDINHQPSESSTDFAANNFQAAANNFQPAANNFQAAPMPEAATDLRETTRGPTLVTGLPYDSSYICEFWGGRFKLLELLMCLVAGLMLPREYEFYHTRFIFFKFVNWTSFTLIIVDLLLHLLGWFDKLWPFLRSADISMFLHGVGCFSFVVCSSLVSNVVDLSGDPDAAIIASCFGFACAVLFGLESLLYCRGIRLSKTQGTTEPHANWS